MVTALNKKKFNPIIICKKDGPIIEKYLKNNIKCYIEPRLVSFIPLKKKKFPKYIDKFTFFKNKEINKKN